MPNALAYLALMIWPLVCVLLFRRLSPQRAVIWSLLAGYLLLPPLAEFDLPLVPDMDKFSIPNICAFALALFLLRERIALWPRMWTARVLMLGFVLGAIPTVLTNSDPLLFQVMVGSDPIIFETDRLPGLRTIDIASVLSNQLIVLLPLLLGRHFFATEEGMRELLRALLIAGLAYSVLALIEIRFSPQINIMVYGFFQHSFEQMIRSGGFRPIVFLPHGLWIALFFVYTVVAAAALQRSAETQMKAKLFMATVYLAAVLLLCKSLASILYASAILPVIFLASVRLQLLLALVFGALAVSYPVLRNLGLIPLDWILAQAEAINPERAHSLNYRFGNEEQLLERAKEKLLFGWGGWGRNLVRDIETSEILTIPDGRWILTFGTYGWLGYLSEMGLLALPLILLGWYGRKSGSQVVSPLAAAVALCLAITLVDMLLNDTLVPFVWLMAGAVLGYAERIRFGRTDSTARSPGAVTPPILGQPRDPRGRRTVL
ncbi:hypothetical protein EI983_15035 [Roseovarius faecimaris]|uniref:O-antigen ligase domain-containing protein n=1 Tax=Roseovarius faecimaris TaxID=2494550 RepID=A0A6I6IV06_9RHOB|nr:hypothetical protein [Roseovarius faecimaris]QGX99511.1 hypothetical protein EI983_15035 [Roseovarius faecimaris]